LKVLVSAYACEPDKGSEPGVGWQWVIAIAANHDVWVCTKGNNKDNIERELRNKPIPNLHFIYVDLPQWLSFWKKGQRGVHLYYYLWQFAAFFHSIKIHRKIGFDIGHHITFVNAWLWTFLALMPIPFIWGPIGTNRKLPPQLLPNIYERAKNLLRYSFQILIRSIDPLYWISVIRADVILVINKDTQNIFPLRYIAKHKIDIEPAIGTDPIHHKSNRDNIFNVLFVGRFILIKGVHLAMEAFAIFSKEKENVRFTLIGEGLLEKRLLHIVKEARIEDKVSIVRWMPREFAIAAMSKSDAFLFPTMEGAGMVVLEAMAAGLPVICLDFGGPSTMVDDKSGIRVAIKSYTETIAALSRALEFLYNNPRIKDSMGSCAAERVANLYTWSKKSEIVDKYYKHIIST
jgi:glycosyltransferase involved in cell wall biosynthesis